MFILERLHGDTALITGDDKEFTVPVSMVSGCNEGDVIILSGDIYVTDKAATEKRRRDILALQNSLWGE